MQNIDIIYVLQPVVVIIIATALLLYWRRKRHFHLSVILYSLVAYVAAIALKVAIQTPTYQPIVNYFGTHSVGLGAYFGLQTAFLEVGLAFVVAWFAVKKGHHLDAKDAEAYGSGLAFWENAAYLGILPLLNYITYYAILSTNSPLAQTVYDQLNANAPALFASPDVALPLVAIGIFERTSSILIHLAWGYLCFMAVYYHKKWLFAIALPMGLIDFFVPFAQDSLILFEVGIFTLSVLSVVVAWYAVRRVKRTLALKAIEIKASA